MRRSHTNNCRFAKLDEAFLNDVVEGMVDRRVREKLLAALLPAGRPVDDAFYKHVLAVITTIQGITGAITCGDGLGDDIQSLYALVERLAVGVPPTEAAQKRMTPFFQQVMTACESLCTAEVTKWSGPKSKLNMTSLTLSGKEAIQEHWAVLVAAPDAEKGKNTEMLKRFK